MRTEHEIRIRLMALYKLYKQQHSPEDYSWVQGQIDALTWVLKNEDNGNHIF